MKVHRVITLTFALFSLTCVEVQQPSIDEVEQTILYINSFETPNDISGFSCLHPVSILNQAPPNGGLKSILISSNLVTINLQDLIKNSCSVKIRCWGKSLQYDGNMYLYNPKKGSYGCDITVSDTVWSFYESLYSLQCQPGDFLQLVINDYGLKYGSILVDLLSIVKVD